MTASTEDVVLRTVGLTKRYGRRLAVEGLNLQVHRGQVYGFLGPNGSGKSTTIGMVLGLLTPTAGYTEMFGLDTRTHRSQALARTGATLEGQSYFPHLSATDNLRVWARASGIDDARIAEVIDIVGMTARARDKIRTYSLGMKQRLAVAAALLSDPELVILDEPTNGLDPAGIREFRQLVRDLAARGKTIFVSSHILSEVELMCDDVGIVKSGRLIVERPVAALRGASSAIELRTTDDDAALDALRALPWVTTAGRQDGRIVVAAPAERAAEISRVLAEKQIYLAELRPQESTLEDFFLEVTEMETPPLRELDAEIRKVRTRWLPYVILIFLLIGAVVQIALFGLVAYLDERGEYGYGRFPPGYFTFVFPWSLNTLLDSGQFWGGVFIAFLIASVVSTEYTWGTVRASVARGQSRVRFLSWKLAGTALTSTVLLLFALAVGVALSLFLTAVRGEPITLDVRGGPSAAEIPVMILRAALGILPYGMLAFCLAVVGRSTALAATGILIYKLMESILLPSLEALGGVWAGFRVFFIGYYADALIAANRFGSLEYNSLALRALPEGDKLPDPWVSALMLVLYTLAFAAIAFYVFLRRDLTISSE